MSQCVIIDPYMRRPLVKYCMALQLIPPEFPYIRANFIFFFYQCKARRFVFEMVTFTLVLFNYILSNI
jgi:hypothetical protein